MANYVITQLRIFFLWFLGTNIRVQPEADQRVEMPSDEDRRCPESPLTGWPAGCPAFQASVRLTVAGALVLTSICSQLPCAHSLASPSFSAHGHHTEGAPALLASCRVLLAALKRESWEGSLGLLAVESTWRVFGPSRAPLSSGGGGTGAAARGKRPARPCSLWQTGLYSLLPIKFTWVVTSESKKKNTCTKF